MKDRKYYKRCYVSTVFSVFSIIFSYTVYTNPKNKTKQTTTQTNKQTNKQLLFVQSAPVREYYGVFRQDVISLVVGEDHASHGA